MNPDADSWVASFIEWYLDPDSGCVDKAKSGIVRWFVRDAGQIIWGDSSEELKDRFPHLIPRSFTFVRADIHNNKILMERDPSYLANLMALHPIDRDRLLYGSWTSKAEAGKVFRREWFEVVEPEEIYRKSMQFGYEEVRFWDMAATDADLTGSDPSATSGTKMRMIMDGSDTVYVMDSINRMIGPGEVNNLIKNISSQDGNLCKVRWEIEPGSASVRNTYDMINMLMGYNALGATPEANKVVRAKPLATAAWQGKIKLVRGAWNDRWLKSAVNFPDDAKGKESKAVVAADGTKERPGNDDVDSAAGAYAMLTGNAGVYKEHHGAWSR